MSEEKSDVEEFIESAKHRLEKAVKESIESMKAHDPGTWTYAWRGSSLFMYRNGVKEFEWEMELQELAPKTEPTR